MKGLVIIFFLSFFTWAHTQELNCSFSLNSSQIQGTNKQVFETLEKAIMEFMNNRVWTNHIFESHERIECNLFMTINDYTSDVFKGSLQIQARRPVFNSSYNTVMFNYVDDDIEFKYIEFDPLEFSETSYLSDLTSILAYYAYLILGLDYDTYSLMGGTPFFEAADKIVLNAQSSSGYAGWKGSDDRLRKNRYWLVNNILDDDYLKLREFGYNYHIKGLDVMENSLQKGQDIILESLRSLKAFHDSKPDPFMHYFEVVVQSKSNEIVQIYRDTPRATKTQVYSIMRSIDPGAADKYEPLKE